jgi:hypothetical protein
LLNNLNLKNTTILYNDLKDIKKDVPLNEQLNELKEDLLQIEINKNYLVDVGFYPAFSSQGSLKILLIKDSDWENPVLSEETKDLKKLPQLIQVAMDKANNI